MNKLKEFTYQTVNIRGKNVSSRYDFTISAAQKQISALKKQQTGECAPDPNILGSCARASDKPNITRHMRLIVMYENVRNVNE